MQVAAQIPSLTLETARPFLRYITGLTSYVEPTIAFEKLAEWLVWHGLGPLAYRCCKVDCPQLADRLRISLYNATAKNSIHFANLESITDCFVPDLPVVLLKGVALAEEVYGGQSYRPMSDIDLWVPMANREQALRLMQQAGFSAYSKERRPLALQMLSNGEVQFYQEGWSGDGLVELHLSPFKGWWLFYTANVDTDGVWQRIQPMMARPDVWQLAPEDCVIHLAVHTAVNHQFDLAFVRSLVDIVLTAEQRGVDWSVVAERAQEWRVGTAVYTVLSLLNIIIGLPGLDAVLETLSPPAWQRHLLAKIIKPEQVMNGSDSFSGSLRFVILLLLVDRNRDRLKLIGRTFWPSPEWLEARYGKKTAPWTHWWHILRTGDV